MGISRSKIEGYMLPTVKGKYYEKESVDRLLVDLANDADATLLDLQDKRNRITELEKREESIAQALIIVKQLSEQIVAKAKAEAEKIIMESTARQMELQEEVSRLETLRDTYRADLDAEIRTLMDEVLKKVNKTEE
jgi:hypothetical protein